MSLNIPAPSFLPSFLLRLGLNDPATINECCFFPQWRNIMMKFPDRPYNRPRLAEVTNFILKERLEGGVDSLFYSSTLAKNEILDGYSKLSDLFSYFLPACHPKGTANG